MENGRTEARSVVFCSSFWFGINLTLRRGNHSLKPELPFRGRAGSAHSHFQPSKEFELNPTIPVTSNTPPTFLLQAEDDPVDDVKNSLVYYLKQTKQMTPAGA